MPETFLATLVQGLFTTRYAELASSVIITYDHLVTLDQEVELIWKSGWSFGKCLFLLNRYYTLFVVFFNNFVLFDSNISNNVGTIWFRWQGISGLIAFIMSELILQLRLYALYSLNKRVLLLMGSVFAGCLVASATIMGFALSEIHTVAIPYQNLSFCLPSNLPQITFFFAFWIPVMVSETLLCTLVIFKAVRGWRRQDNLLDSGRALVAVLIRDSIFYFLVLFGVYLVNMIIFISGDIVKTEAAINYAVSMSCVMGNRLCLNVRGMIWQDEDIVITHSWEVGRRHTAHPSTGRAHPPQRWPVMVFASSDAQESHVTTKSQLSEYEMDELRSMRVGHHDNRIHPLALKDQFGTASRAGRI